VREKGGTGVTPSLSARGRAAPGLEITPILKSFSKTPGLGAASKEPITITHRGRPLVEVVPWRPKTAASTFGTLAGSVLHEDDLVSPAADASEFEACR